jgi:large subunit ribosomal protein L35
MPKLKTRKAIAKRIKVTGRKRLKMRHAGQDHFNARQTGKTKRNKRRLNTVAKTLRKSVKRQLPYS